MTAHLQRALLLIEQARYEPAEEQLRQHLLGSPNEAYPHALLALCLSRRGQYGEATREAQTAITLGPDQPFVHYALAHVLRERRRYKEALAAIDEAIRLDPEDADFHASRAAIAHQMQDWQAALAAADEGLKCDPEHIDCINLRAASLVKLGRRDEAGQSLAAALAKSPDDATTHANQGWALLHAGMPKEAMLHFREALRLEPESEWARAGIVESLKARNILYRLLLQYFLWMQRFQRGSQLVILIGAFVVYRVVLSLAENNPNLAPFLWPLLVAYIAFALMTWLAYPLFNLLLRLNRFGRLALSREAVVASNWLGATLLAAIALLLVWIVGGWEVGMIGALWFGLLSLPVAGIFSVPEGWPRQAMAAGTGILAAGAVLVLGCLAANVPLISEDVTLGFIRLFPLAVVGMLWASNGLATVTVRR